MMLKKIIYDVSIVTHWMGNPYLQYFTGEKAFQDLSWNLLNLISGVSKTENGTTTQLASYTWYADGTKYSAERPDGSGYVYKGNVIYERAANGTLTLDCVLTTGGRIVASKNSSGAITGYTVYHHITDHLGSVRAITDASTGTVVETSDYLPFGTRWSQTSGSSSATITDATNRWRYSGKEEQKAINSTLPLIDYGARMYDPTIARWMSVDPMAEKYYPMSPYGYCAGNPINIIDPQGLATNPVYDSNGTYRGNTKEGFTGVVIIYDGNKPFSEMTAPELLYDDFDYEVQRGDANTFDNVKNQLSGSAKSKIWTHIVSQMEGKQVYDEVFSLSTLKDGIISYSSTSTGAWNSSIKAKTINGSGKYTYETTVENIQSSVVVHEWYSHIMKGNTDQLKSHRLAYKNVINYKALWNNTTDAYKKFNISQLLKYTSIETGRNQVDPPYRNLYKKYIKK